MRTRKHPFKNVLLFGSGPIVIGQACEFDYSGSQACKALREEGLRVILLNSNPATIMTDPGMADRTYIEPLDPMTVIEILRKEQIEAILPTMGGQTGLNLILALSKIPGALDDVEIIGANLKSILLAEDRRAFRELCMSMGMDSPRATTIRSVEECQVFAQEIGFPFILRPSFTLGGTGQSMVYSADELVEKTRTALIESPIGESLVEESVLGWKEYELEVMRDTQDNAIIVCSIENVDAMGVHTGDSITVAPQQTLTDREYQAMRLEALSLVRAVGVETGGCNVQFGVQPETGRRVVIEMNPRVSRSSALASKATGFPIAYVAAKLALGYTLPEIQNTVTKTTKACFEPPIDYVAVKIPRWHFEKFPGAQDILLPQMQSVGEVLAFGSNFGEAYFKALNSLERGWPKYEPVISKNPIEAWTEESSDLLKKAHSRRPYAIWDALAGGISPEDMALWTGWDPWFTREIRRYQQIESLGARATRMSKAQPTFEMIDTCSAESRATTPFYYSTRSKLGAVELNGKKYVGSAGPLAEIPKDKRGRVAILGSGPNRIGQGIEFDYCCVHASMALQKMGFETIMINCNPETVSTDPSISTRLYLEPLTEDCVLPILERELRPCTMAGKEAYVLVQTGGQTPLKLAGSIEKAGFQILGTSKAAIDLAEDRVEFAGVLKKLGIAYPEFATATTLEETRVAATQIGFPILVRPSFVLGGRGMKVCGSEKDLLDAFTEAKEVSEDYPLFLDKFLNEAVEFDIDGICDGSKAWVSGIMEHVEEAGIHSGDSSCVIPPFRLPPAKIEEMAKLAKAIAVATGARGFFNIQMAVMGDKVFVLEANPRASRTVPFLAKATGYPLIEWGLRTALGEKVEGVVDARLIPGDYRLPSHGYAVKVPVFPFNKFRATDPVLGPEMRSTGEVMGMDATAGGAFAKAFLAAGMKVPVSGGVLFSVRDQDKPRALGVARVFHLLGFDIYGTPGTAAYLDRAGVPCTSTQKLGQAALGEDLLALLKDGRVTLVVNTTGSLGSLRDGVTIRKAALSCRIPLLSTLSGAEMASMAIQTVIRTGVRTVALQDFIARAQPSH